MKEAQALGKMGNWEFDINTQKIEWSDETYRLYERDKALGPPSVEEEALYYSPEEAGRLREFARLACERGERFEYDLTARLPSGKNKFFHATMQPITDNKGQVIRLFGTVQDITEQREMQEQLMLADRLASIGQLVTGIAHEINNPLTSVIGFSELLLEKDLPDEIREDLETIGKEAKRAANVLKGLRTFVRSRGTEKTLVDINSIIREVLQLRSYEQRVSNIEVDTRLTPDLPYVFANGAQMQQVFMNMIINAEQAMIEAHGRGILKVTTEKAGEMVRISVDDDGPGISPENMRRLFTPFFTTKEVGKGTGIGLSICHGIVAEHGGGIHAESEPGKGASFIVELPIPARGGEADKKS